MTDIIEVLGVTKRYPGGVLAVDDVTLRVREGEFVTLLGPSGCGKTTTLRMIAGFETPDRGRIALAGSDVTDLPPYRRPVNTVFQDYALFPNLTVADNVGYGLDVAGYGRADARRRVAEALELVDLGSKAKDRPHKLSGGQKQRVALARALVREPKVLLLDEPLSALDAKLRESMQVELKHLHDRLGLTFILVTHDQTEALVMSDRIVVMNEGRIEQEGSPSALYDRPSSPYVASFLGSSNLLPGRVVAADVSGGTDTHVVLLDLRGIGMTGKVADLLVSDVHITANKNTVPFDPESPFVTSGLRLGTAALTTRGFDAQAFREVADVIADRLLNPEDDAIRQRCLDRVAVLCERFPLYADSKQPVLA